MHLIKQQKKENQKNIIFASKSIAGFNQMQKNKINQDEVITLPQNLKNQYIFNFGICDGHGENGHLVSQFIKQNLHSILEVQLNQNQNLKVCIQKAFSNLNKLINEQRQFDVNLSGSTLCNIYITEKKIFCANVGDSRAIFAKKLRNNQYIIQKLSNDHSPYIQQEYQRIIKAGGIKKSKKQKKVNGSKQGPLRVWLKNKQAPGLAMTRSFGDKIGVQAGIVCDPEIIEFDYQQIQQNGFIIVASDGIWSIIDNEEAVNLVKPFYEQKNVEEAVKYLINRALFKWKKVYIYFLFFFQSLYYILFNNFLSVKPIKGMILAQSLYFYEFFCFIILKLLN
ncbi:protein phosphatase 2c, putative [Ichthyophthirius multifiliis]|uniref:Protein phosphatase 2c, putative n=1 Tax=Ichthyophthirius multifiliis TaxID=5932 RepID=G0R3D5_ICHMU|nr:protein phosphatase 2c, putative [Ichthyophthirius multifiliis]EGR28009.1 protein phosphatase 2c, putative [Ichthyophthirius multifiliis]|eukprot:XP_004027354.1 protein phosphatase 2c, putative [Ichthyophthirius multifiliis]